MRVRTSENLTLFVSARRVHPTYIFYYTYLNTHTHTIARYYFHLKIKNLNFVFELLLYIAFCA